MGAGSEYAHSGGDEYQDLLNLMRQAAEGMTLSMATNRPRFLATARKVEHQAFADHFSAALNTYAETMHLEETLQECVRNAFYHLGIAKVSFGVAITTMVESDEWMTPGAPYVGCVSPVHFCYDTDATHWRHCGFLADRYRVRFRDLVNDERFDRSVRKQIEAMGPQAIQTANSEELGRSLSQHFRSSEFEEFVYLADVFLPRDGIIYTFPCDEKFHFTTDKPIYSQEWEGRETGPYHFLNLGPIPDKTTPSPPALSLKLLHDMANSVFRKLGDQANRQKQFAVGGKECAEDVELLRTIEDGGFATLNNPQGWERFTHDGPSQVNYAFGMTLLQLFSKQANNLDHQLGLGQTADTLGQEGMIGQNIGRLEAFYQQRFVKFTGDIAEELSRLLYEDEATKIQMTQQIPGTSFMIDDPWKGALYADQGSRQGEFSSYSVRIEPYSMEYRSPRQRLDDINAYVDRAIQLSPLLMQQNKAIDLDHYFKLCSRYTDTPEIERLIVDIQPPQQEDQQGGQPGLLGGGGGQHEYIHRNVSSGNKQGLQNDMISQLMSASGSAN